MDQHSQTDDTPHSRGVLEGQVRECYGRVVYSHKTHEKCADILLIRLGRIELAQVILSALTTAGFIAAVAGTGRFAVIAGAFVSTGLLVLNSYIKNNDLGATAQKHRQAASDLWLIREQFQSLLVDLAMREKPIELLQEQRDDLIRRLHQTYRGAPSTNSKAYGLAQTALQKLEDMTFSDAEVDAFLPNELKRTPGVRK